MEMRTNKRKLLLSLIVLTLSCYIFLVPNYNPQPGRCSKRHCVSCPVPSSLSTPRVKAAVTILCRNGELEGVKHSLKTFEPLFNARFEYPYVFLNEEPFTPEFIEV
jgi:hypothetical protein